jgi:Arc/MetJ family transcription regulator
VTVTKAKITVSIDQDVLARAKDLFGDQSTSSVLEKALRDLVRAASNQRDAEMYRRIPLSEDELSLASYQPTYETLDDTDWDALYPDPAQ